MLKKRKALQLDTTTIRQLDNLDLKEIAGGWSRTQQIDCTNTAVNCSLGLECGGTRRYC